MERREFLRAGLFAGIAGLSGCVGSQRGDGEETTTLTMGAGSQGSGVWGAATALQKVVSEETDDIEITAQQTGGTKANLRLYSRGKVDLSITSDYVYDLAKRDRGSYAENPIERFPLQGFDTIVAHEYLLAREGTDISTYGDLVGKRVWPYQSGASFRLPIKAVLEELGLWGRIRVRGMDPNDVAGALEAGQLDAIAAAGASYKSIVGWSKQVDAQMDLKVVRADNEVRMAMERVLPEGYEEIEPYGWENQDFAVDAVAAIPIHTPIYLGGGEVSEDVAYRLTMLAHEHTDSMEESFPGLLDLSAPENLAGGIISDYPVHPGVAKALRELDAWDDDWTVG